jgi:transcriptional regulator with PAS, ATPase and Fis domain
MRLDLPPLKDRKGDIPLLISHILKRLCATRNTRVEKFSNDAMEVLLNHDYPGNVRELENIIEHALIVCQDKIIERNHLPLSFQGGIAQPPPVEAQRTFDKEIEFSEKTIIFDMLRKHNWNKGKTAAALHINRTTLWRKMKKYNI